MTKITFQRGAAAKLLLVVSAGLIVPGLEAAPVYSLESMRYFGDPGSRVTGVYGQPFTGSTNDQHVVNYSDGNFYNGRSAIRSAPVVMETSTSVAINQAVTTDNPVGFLARDRATLYDSVLVTGGAGTAYLTPVVHITGQFTDDSSALYGSVSACFGTSTCTLLGIPGGASAGGVQNVDVMWSPSPSIYPPGFEITFGAPVTTYMFFGTNVIAAGGNGVTVPGGEAVDASFRYELMGYLVLDGDGNEIRGASVQSDALGVPEPAPGVLMGLGLGLVLVRTLRRKRRKGLP